MMSATIMVPRSVLHALQPQAWGTSQVESLLSYVCRLAVSHSTTMPGLMRMIADRMGADLRADFTWHERNLSGLSDENHSFASAVAELTGVGQLDKLTMLPWRPVISPRGLAASTGAWCPACFADDLREGVPPYFRLAWDIASVTVCVKHKSPLTHVCPECGKTGVRHKGSCVLPGWCSRCGASLATDGRIDETPVPARPENLWRARQVGQLLKSQFSLEQDPDLAVLRGTLLEVISRMDAGRGASFAHRIGVAKATVHNWLKDGGIPGLEASLCVAAHSGLSLTQLLTGDLNGWKVPTEVRQSALPLGSAAKSREAPRQHDWPAIQAQLDIILKLPQPISVAEAARQLHIDVRLLYLHANRQARTLSERWRQFLSRTSRDKRQQARAAIEDVCRGLRAENLGCSMREIEQRVPSEILNGVEGLYEMVADVVREIEADH